jgi:hypothetical protein
MPDEEIFQNNSKRIRECVVARIRLPKLGGVPLVYLLPTMKELFCEGRIDGGRFLDDKINGVDWSGGDGWLNFDPN